VNEADRQWHEHTQAIVKAEIEVAPPGVIDLLAQLDWLHRQGLLLSGSLTSQGRLWLKVAGKRIEAGR
jgi:hypothetical protein